MGRSGSTLLQRVLNVHPELTIWGEHNAFLRGMLESDFASRSDAAMVKNLEDGFANRSSVIGELSNKEAFKPWVSPFLATDVSDAIRALVIDLFTRGLEPEIRWGFKEIRYTDVEMRRLMEMFPESHLIVLGRDVPGYAMSRFFAFGFTNYELVTDEGREKASRRIENIVRGWITRYQGLMGLVDAFPERTSVVAYSDLVSGSDRPRRLFEELGETPPSAEAIEAVLGAKTGSSFQHNSGARSNRNQLAELIAAADVDHAEINRLSRLLGIA